MEHFQPLRPLMLSQSCAFIQSSYLYMLQNSACNLGEVLSAVRRIQAIRAAPSDQRQEAFNFSPVCVSHSLLNDFALCMFVVACSVMSFHLNYFSEMIGLIVHDSQPILRSDRFWLVL